MAEAIFEWVDKNNKTHQVDDIYKVPEEYRGNVLVTGIDQPAEGEEVQAETAVEGVDFGGFDIYNYTPAPSHYAVLVAAILFVRSKNYALRCILGGAIALWGIYAGGSWFASSDLMKTSVDKLAEDGKKSDVLKRQK